MAKPPRSSKKAGAVALLLAMVLLGVFPIDVLLPSFPALSHHFDTSGADIALSISLFAIGISLSQLLIGPLSDRLGRKNLLLAGMAVSLFGALGCVASGDYRLFLLFRLVQAIGCGCFVLSQALVQDLFSGKERERLRILIVTASGIFISISPLLGSILQAWLDWPGSFYFFSALALLVLLKAWVSLENPSPSAATPHSMGILQAYRQVCSSSAFFGYWLIAASAFACHFSFIVISPLLFMERLHLDSYQFALTLLLYGVAYVVGGVLAGILNRRLEAGAQIVIGLFLILCSGLSMAALTGVYGLSLATVMGPMLFCTAGVTIARPAATSRAMELFPDYAGTSASAGNTLVFVVGGAVSALVNLYGERLQLTLAASLVLLACLGLLLSQWVGRQQRDLNTA
ncbi:multidrug transporter CflA [Pseudomonas aeruginosa]|uniref:MFS transporter n=1 Tax=Pseudomonas aeruginosa TaxID=287 RepID=UPI000F532FCE|nr:MFS transporter [Pseudomonas aeruginosa]MCO2075357.1 multidrug effflux MFS transporter [Pseudomonas aeruginosa]RQF50335.1 multidrug transporter CflA [Pseudomonas aeruginosa]